MYINIHSGNPSDTNACESGSRISIVEEGDAAVRLDFAGEVTESPHRSYFFRRWMSLQSLNAHSFNHL